MMNNVMKVVLIVCALVFGASLTLLFFIRPTAGTGAAQSGSGGISGGGLTAADSDTRRLGPFDPLPGLDQLRVLPITLETHDGRTIDESVFDGRITIMDFVFTDCIWICPTLTGTMSILNERLARDDVRFLSISVNPERDTRERLTEYAAKFNAVAPRWTFARGDKHAIWDFCERGLLFAVEPDPASTVIASDGTLIENIRHPSWFALVGPDRKVLGIYRSTDDNDVERLETRARNLSRLLAEGKGPVPPAARGG